MLEIMKVNNQGQLLKLEEKLPSEVKTTAEAMRIMKSGDLPGGDYVILKIHGGFTVSVVKQMKIEKLNYGEMVRA